MINLFAFFRGLRPVIPIAGLCCLIQPIFAEPQLASEIYAAKVELKDGSSNTRREAFKDALGKVLVKLSGTREILEAPEIEAVINSPTRYIRTYSEEKMPDEELEEDLEEEVSYGVLLQVEFDGPALERALIAAGLPVWTGDRQPSLVWLAVEEGRRRYIVADESDAVILDELHNAANERGLPITLPLMDRQDRRLVEYVDIRGGFSDRLLQAAERYNSEILLVGALQLKGKDNWSVKWTVLRENTSSSWIDSKLTLQEAVRSGIDGLGDILALRYAFSAPGGQKSDYFLLIDNVMTLEHYAEILAVLENLVFVEAVTPIHIEDTSVKYRLRMRGSIAELERALSLQANLLLVDSAAAEENSPVETAPMPMQLLVPEKTELHFIWQP